jgi:hypothetical protein
VYGGEGRVSEATGLVCDASLKWDESVYDKSESEESPGRCNGKVVEESPLGLSDL